VEDVELERDIINQGQAEQSMEEWEGGTRSRRSQAGTQSTARTMVHCGVEGGRSHGGYLADNTRGKTEDESNGGGDPGEAEEPMNPHNINGSGLTIAKPER